MDGSAINHEPTPNAFGDLLRESREANGLTQEALAERAGLSARAISALERGVNRAPRLDTLQRLTLALTLTVHKREALMSAARPGVTPVHELAGAVSLPIPATRLVGREREVDAVEALLQHPEPRLVTLTGPGGVGKTRLALQVAADLAGLFDDGVAYVDLAEVRDSDGVIFAIGQALSVREMSGRTIVDQVCADLRKKHHLLVLDNFEHVVAAAPLVARMLASAARVKILVTSRIRLRLRGEHEFVVAPLAVPEPADRSQVAAVVQVQYPSVALFVERARAAGLPLPLDNEMVGVLADICRQLDGLPLAIELAAARSRVLPPFELRARLGAALPILTHGAPDAPARQRTMRDAIGWSYALLGAAEQSAFLQLSVCVGGCSLATAEGLVQLAVTETTLSPLDAVAALVDHSLVQALEDDSGELRLSMLETVREYGLEQLARRADGWATRERHAQHFAELAVAARPHIMGSAQQSAWLRRLDRERANLTAALYWGLERQAFDLGLRLADAIGPFWYFRGNFSEGRQWMERYLELTAQMEANPARLWLLYGVGKLADAQGDIARVAEVAVEARMLATALDSALGKAQALELQASVAQRRGDPLKARELLEAALLESRRAADRGQLQRVLYGLGHAARAVGDLSRAELAFEELLPESRADGPTHGEARVLASLGQVAAERGDDDRAAVRYREALYVFVPIGDPAGMASCLQGLARVARRRGDPERSARLYAAAAALCESAGIGVTAVEMERTQEDVARARASLGDAEFGAAWAEGQSLTVERAVAYAIE
jgi:predicted ATPase/DNA-binding XRE family transcriptional regulator